MILIIGVLIYMTFTVNFTKSFYNKQNIKKNILKYIDLIIHDSLLDGCMFFFITFDFKKLNKNYIDAFSYISDILNNNIQLLNYSHLYFNPEKNTIYVILGVKSLIGFNPLLITNLKDCLNKHFGSFFTITYLKTYNEITQHYNFILKKFFKNEKNHLIYPEKSKWVFFCDLYDYCDSCNIKIIQGCFESKWGDIKGILIKDCFFNYDTLFKFWNYYLVLNGLCEFNNELYKKKENTLFSYQHYGKLNSLLTSFDVICFFFVSEFPIHFKNFDFNIFKKFILELVEKEEFSLKNLITNKIVIKHTLLEFKNGVYFLDKNTFVEKKDVNADLIDYRTTHYYPIDYSSIGSPIYWINLIKNIITDETTFKCLCFYLGNCILKKKFLNNDKKVLQILNDNKVAVRIIFPLLCFYGIKNVNHIRFNLIFQFYKKHPTELVVIDIVDFFKTRSLIFLYYIIKKNKTSLIILNNSLCFQKKRLSEKIDNLCYNVLLIDSDDFSLSEYNNNLKDEEPYIIIYWVQQLHEYYK